MIDASKDFHTFNSDLRQGCHVTVHCPTSYHLGKSDKTMGIVIVITTRDLMSRITTTRNVVLSIEDAAEMANALVLFATQCSEAERLR